MKKKVLLLSDKKENSKLISVLNELEYEIDVADEISDALKKTKEGLHILLLDVESDSINEKDVLQLIKIAKKDNIKIISVSKPFSERIDRFIKLGGSFVNDDNEAKLTKEVKRTIDNKNESKPEKLKIGSSKVSLILIPDDGDLTEIGFNIISKNPSKKIIYISLEKSNDFLIKELDKKSIPSKNVFVIDCISAFYRPIEHTENCYYALAPYELKDISIAIKNNIKKNSIIIFDSLTNLLSYGREVPSGVDKLKRFVDSFKEELEKTNSKILFLCKNSDKNSGLIKEADSVFEDTREIEYKYA